MSVFEEGMGAREKRRERVGERGTEIEHRGTTANRILYLCGKTFSQDPKGDSKTKIPQLRRLYSNITFITNQFPCRSDQRNTAKPARCHADITFCQPIVIRLLVGLWFRCNGHSRRFIQIN